MVRKVLLFYHVLLLAKSGAGGLARALITAAQEIAESTRRVGCSRPLSFFFPLLFLLLSLSLILVRLLFLFQCLVWFLFCVLVLFDSLDLCVSFNFITGFLYFLLHVFLVSSTSLFSWHSSFFSCSFLILFLSFFHSLFLLVLSFFVSVVRSLFLFLGFHSLPFFLFYFVSFSSSVPLSFSTFALTLSLASCLALCSSRAKQRAFLAYV